MADIRNRLDELELFRKKAREAQIERERRRPDLRGKNVTEIRTKIWRLPVKSKPNG
jgi:hypothetical protein